MGLRLIYGRSGTGKTTFCFREISELIKQGKQKIIVITPEQFSFTAEQHLMQAVGKEAVLHAEVLTFERMAYRVMQEVGEANKTSLTDCGRAILLDYILERQKNKLHYLGKTDKNVDMVSSMLTEFKKHNVTEEQLANIVPTIENKILAYKLEDVATIYEAYNHQIQGNFIDENDALTILYNHLDEVDLFNDAILYIDEFAGFTKQEYRIIDKLLTKCKQVNVSICTDDLQDNTNPDTDLFYPNKQAVGKLIELTKQNKVNIEKAVALQERYRYKNEEVSTLEEGLAGSAMKAYNHPCQNIQLFLANNLYAEVEYVANNIIQLVRDEGYHYHDIAIITKQIDSYASLIKAIFSKYGIPVFIDEKKELTQNILVKYITALLDIFAKNWSIEAMFNYIKTGFLDIEQEDIYLLENYCKNFGIKGYRKYTEEWKVTGNDRWDLEKLNALRAKITEPLQSMKEKLGREKTLKEMTTQLYEFLVTTGIDQKMVQKSEDLRAQGNIELANNYDTSWNLVMEILDEMVLVLGDEKISFEQYAELLKVGLNHRSLGKIPATLDEVTVGDVDRSRSSKKRAVFIISLNDGVFPSTNKNEGLIDDEERVFLRDQGVELAKTMAEQLYDENYNIYKAFTTAEEKLFLSYASSDSEGKGLRKSILLKKIRKIFPQLEEQSDLNSQKETTYIATKGTTFDSLVLELRKYFNGEEIAPIWFEIYRLYAVDADYKEALQDAIQGFGYTNLPERVTEENLKKLYGDTVQTSISRLETYQRCPFSYYIKYGLKLSDRTEFKVESLDTGTFMHDVIDTFFNEVRDENLNIRELEEDVIRKIVEHIIDEKLKADRNYIFTSTAKYLFLTNRLKKVIFQSVKYILKTIILSDFDILGNEVEFKNGAKYPPIEIALENGQKLQIIGKIDRVDIAENEDGKYIRIIDYKSSVKNIDLNEMMAGIQIQLLTYLDAAAKQEEADPAGLLYFNLIEPVIKTKNKYLTEEQLEEEIKKNFRMNGLILGDVKVVQMMDNSLTKGKSEMIPAYIDAKGDVSKAKSSSVDSAEFQLLQTQIKKILKQIAQGMLTGNISPKPVYIEKKKSTPCMYCNYKSICGFNPELKGNGYTYVPNLDKNVILDKLKSETRKI